MFNDVTFPDEDEYLYYYDGKGPDCYEAFCMTPEDGTVYNCTSLHELNESLYGYIDMEPDIYFRCTHLNQKSDRLDVWDLVRNGAFVRYVRTPLFYLLTDTLSRVSLVSSVSLLQSLLHLTLYPENTVLHRRLVLPAFPDR